MRALLSLLRRPLGTALVLALSAACGADDPAGDASGDTSGSGEDATGDSGCDLAVAPVADAPCACVGDQWEGQRDGCDQICFCTNRGWQCRADGCVDATGDEGDSPTSSAALSWQGPVTVREVTGNGDGKAQPGEAWEVVTRLASDVEAPGVDTVVRIESISPRVRIDEASSPYAGVSATGVDVAMPFRIADDASAGVASIELSAFVPGGFSTRRGPTMSGSRPGSPGLPRAGSPTRAPSPRCRWRSLQAPPRAPSSSVNWPVRQPRSSRGPRAR
jgi:hypothetical protein